MNIWMMLMILMQTSCQFSHISPTQEADPDHSHMSTEVEQMEERQKGKNRRNGEQ